MIIFGISSEAVANTMQSPLEFYASPFWSFLALNRLMPLQVPSAYFLTDMFIYFHGLMDRRIFHPDTAKNETITSLASEEGVLMKKLVGSLRALWRSSKDGGYDERVKELKSWCKPSPNKSSSKSEAAEGSQDDQGQAEPENEAEDEKCEDVERVEESGDVGEELEEESGEESDVMEDSDGGEVEAGPQEAGPQEPPTPESLKAPTIRLDDARESPAATTDEDEMSEEASSCTGPISDEEEELPDSQVSSGWLGKTIAWENEQKYLERLDREHKQKVEYQLRSMQYEIEEALKEDIGTKCLVWQGYKEWARKALIRHGHAAYGHLASVKTWKDWCRAEAHEKQQQAEAHEKKQAATKDRAGRRGAKECGQVSGL